MTLFLLDVGVIGAGVGVGLGDPVGDGWQLFKQLRVGAMQGLLCLMLPAAVVGVGVARAAWAPARVAIMSELIVESLIVFVVVVGKGGGSGG